MYKLFSFKIINYKRWLKLSSLESELTKPKHLSIQKAKTATHVPSTRHSRQIVRRGWYMNKLVHWETRYNEAEVQDLDWGEPSVNRRPVSVSLSLSFSHMWRGRSFRRHTTGSPTPTPNGRVVQGMIVFRKLGRVHWRFFAAILANSFKFQYIRRDGFIAHVHFYKT